MAAVMKEDDDKAVKEEIIITEVDPATAKAAPEADKGDKTLKAPDAEDEEDARIRAADDASAKDDAEREAIRERRRLEKIDRKKRRDEAIARDTLEMNFLRSRNDDLERRLTAQEQRALQSDLTSIDARIAAANHEAELAERVIAKATEAGNGEDLVKALKYRDKAVQDAAKLTWEKQQATQRAAPKQQTGLDDQTARHVDAFLKETKEWYDPQGRNEDSAIMLAIDQGLVRDGYDSKSPEYWSELRKRAARRLPDRFGETVDTSAGRKEDDRQARGGPAVGSGREHAPASTRTEVYINPERRKALEDAGVWDDPVLRMRYVKQYAAYDKQNKA